MAPVRDFSPVSEAVIGTEQWIQDTRGGLTMSTGVGKNESKDGRGEKRTFILSCSSTVVLCKLYLLSLAEVEDLVYTTIKTEKQAEENMMGVVRAHSRKATVLPREYGPVNWYNAPVDLHGQPFRFPWSADFIKSVITSSLRVSPSVRPDYKFKFIHVFKTAVLCNGTLDSRCIHNMGSILFPDEDPRCMPGTTSQKPREWM